MNLMVREKLAHQSLEIMDLVEYKTGKPISFIEDNSLMVRAIWKLSDENDNYHLVTYNPRYREHLDHIISHEAGHILRFHEAEPEDKLIPYSTKKHKDRAISQLSKDFEDMARKGIPLKFIIDSFDLYYEGIIHQLTSVPADIRIEEWIADSYPQLRPVQEDALKSQIKESYEVLKPEIEELTPGTIYRATNSMNFAYAGFVSDMLKDKELSLPYKNTIYETMSRELLNYIKEREDRGYAGDREAIDAWAKMLSLKGWYEWMPYIKIKS